ncbi:MAG: hypothetical protein ABIX46_06605 [Burkholderiaceae bacterium]
MAVPWFTLLKKLPWSEVIVNAPAVAQGAKKLWGTVAGRTVETPTAPADAAPSSDAAVTPATEPVATRQDVQRLDARLDAVEAQGVELHRQLLASTELIKSLAEQNAQLVAQVEALRTRSTWTAGIAALLGLVALAALLLPLWR